jgi:hypothetical protein
MTPREALSAGADYLVIGCPITAAPDPLAGFVEQITVPQSCWICSISAGISRSAPARSVFLPNDWAPVRAAGHWLRPLRAKTGRAELFSLLVVRGGPVGSVPRCSRNLHIVFLLDVSKFTVSSWRDQCQLHTGRLVLPRTAESEQLSKSSLIGISERRLAVRSYPFMILDP